MKIEREYAQVYVSNKGARWIEKPHPWVYESDIVEVVGEVENGDLVDVRSLKGKYLGTGLISFASKIRVRILSNNANDVFDKEFFKRRIRYSWQYRKSVLQDSSNCRVVFGEADELSGFTVDKYNDILVVQIASYGMEKRKQLLYECLLEVLEEDGITISVIYERNDIASRELEGLPQQKGYGYIKEGLSEVPIETIIKENDIFYHVDFIEGQKTGFFLDQKYNRALVKEIAKGKRVLDCFTHTGSFALNAAKGEANKVVAVDISQTAIDMAKRNAKLNGLEKQIEFVVADTFEYLEKDVQKRDFDLIILDPPAFTKSRFTTKNAYAGYRNINAKAMKLLGKGGYLVSCSCSHFMSREMFEEMLLEASKLAGVQLKQISFTQQAKDHPMLLNVEETDYLKFYILQVI